MSNVYSKRVNGFSNYSKLYESRLMECNFLYEQNLTADDVINPIKDLITEEFIKNVLQKGKKAIKDVYTSVKDAINSFFKGVVDFFKNFSIKKLTSSIINKVKEIGTKTWNKIKDLLSGFKEFIIENDLSDQNNKPNFSKIWSVLCSKTKSAVNWKEAGVEPDKLEEIGKKVRINESKYDISDEEVKYYGTFEKIAHALGIKNARFNGVVSQIAKKGAIGLIIIGILKASGITLGLVGGLGPVAMAAIGGMLLMAGLIILAIWVCKPYPTLEDCLAYLHMFFGKNLNEVPSIFGQSNVDTDEQEEAEEAEEAEDNIEAKPLKLMYPAMIKNLTALRNILRNYKDISIEGESESKESDRKSSDSNRKEFYNKKKSGDLEVGKIYNYTNKKGETKKVKLLSLTNDVRSGDDKKYLTSDDVIGDNLEKGSVQVISKDKQGNFTNKSPKFAVNKQQLSESFVYDFSTFSINEKDRFGKSSKSAIGSNETYLTESFKKLKRSIKLLEDSKDKGISIDEEFLNQVLEEKMKAKETIKNLFSEIYEHMYGKYSKTMPELDSLYKESVKVIEDNTKVVAEKMARFAKRSIQFEGEGFYSGLAKLGDNLEEYNTTFKEIMESFKLENVKENYVFKKRYNNK